MGAPLVEVAVREQLFFAHEITLITLKAENYFSPFRVLRVFRGPFLLTRSTL